MGSVLEEILTYDVLLKLAGERYLRLLFDENLSLRLVQELTNVYPGSTVTANIGEFAWVPRLAVESWAGER